MSKSETSKAKTSIPDTIPAGESIALIGIGCRFPGGADTPEAFWRFIESGRNAIVEVPADRWDLMAFFDQDPGRPGKTYSKWGGFLDQVDRFDAGFFGISPREAESMDPQQRLLLEVAWEAMEDAGLTLARLAGTDAGVFVGISTHDYSDIHAKDAYTGQLLYKQWWRAEYRCQPHLLRPRPARTQHGCRYGLLFVAGCGAPGLPRYLGWRMQRRDRGWR